MNLLPLLPRRLRRAFTLVELLTVIAIIAILMGLLLSGLAKIKDRALRTDAAAQCANIITSAQAFHTDYGRFPNPLASAPAISADTIVGDPTGGSAAGNENLFNILRAIPQGTNANHALNPKKISFMQGRAVSDPAKPKGGFAQSGAYFDPWGAQYCVALDMDGDTQLTTLPYADFTGATKGPRVTVGAYSLGKDGKLGLSGSYRSGSDKSDDIISWQ
jgi:prepilin-type N-terminal cleavage/methylation domain-containing protein